MQTCNSSWMQLCQDVQPANGRHLCRKNDIMLSLSAFCFDPFPPAPMKANLFATKTTTRKQWNKLHCPEILNNHRFKTPCIILLFSLDSGLWNSLQNSLHLATSFIQSGHWSMRQSTPGYVIHSVWTVVYATVYTWLCHSFSLDTGLWDSLHTGLWHSFSLDSGLWDSLHTGLCHSYTWLCHSFSLDSGLCDSLHLAMSFIQSGQWSVWQSTPG